MGGIWVVGWNRVIFEPRGYANQAITPWSNMDRLEVYRSGPATGVDTTQYIIFKDIRLVKYKNNDLIKTGLSEKGIITGRRVSEVGPADGMLAWWKLEGNVKDACGKYTGSIEGNPQVVPVLNGNGYMFDGDTDRIAIPVNLTLKDNTICVLYKKDNTQTANYAKVLSNSDGTVGIYQTSAGSSNIWGYVGTSQQWLSENPKVNLFNQFAYLVITSNSITGKQKVFVNGVDVTSTSTNLVYSQLTISNLYIGESGFKGTVGEVRIYDRVLTDEEIGILYKWGLSGIGMQVSDLEDIFINKIIEI